MNELLAIANHLKEKHLSALIKRLLNLILTASLTSWVFRRAYYDYDLLNFQDYKAYYFFFVDGNFIVPLSIFFLIWTLTYYVGLLIFKLGNMFVSRKWRRRVMEFSLEQALQKYHRVPKDGSYLISQKDRQIDQFMTNLFRSLLDSLNEVDMAKFRKYVSRLHHQLEEEFVLLFRATVCITVFIFVVPHFGGFLFTILIASLLFYIFLLFLMYQLIEIVPVVFAKSILELERVLKANGVPIEDESEIILDPV